MKNIMRKSEIAMSLILGISILSIGILSFIFPNQYVIAALTVNSLIMAFLLARSYKKKLSYLLSITESINNGELPEEKEDQHIAGLTTPLRSLHYKMEETVDFVKNLGDENYTFKYIDAESKVGSTLVNLSKQQNEYAQEERKRSWKNEGLAKFSEILRMDDQDTKAMSYSILSNLIQYTEVNQGGFFIADEEDGKRYMEMTACYAYDRKKFIDVRIGEGQGLLGQVMLEKETIYLTDIPSDYVHITSGLGEATPKNVIIIPLISNDQFYGAIELASFDILESYKVDFLNELAENIAAAVASIKINENTRKLLQESQLMSQELQSREEEMKQNMEELQATQEEMTRNQAELNGLFSAIDLSQGLAEFDEHGLLLSANDKLLQTLEYSTDDLKGKQTELLPERGSDDWIQLKQGKNVRNEFRINTKSGREVWLNGDYSAVLNSQGDFKKILMLSTDVTARKAKEVEFERLSLVANNTDNSVIITNADGFIEYVNDGFVRLTGYSHEEMMDRRPGDVLQGPDTDPETIQRISEQLKNKESLYEEILNYDKEGNSYWISLAISPVFNAAGELDKFISIQANITETKEIALDYHYKLEAIGRSNAVIEFDMKGNILEANKNFLSIFGYSAEEVVGKHHKIFVTPEEAETKEYKEFWEKLSSKEFVSDEFKRIDKEGNEIWLKGVYNPIYNLQGEATKVVKFATDITRERKLQMETEQQQKEITSHLETIDKTIASLEFDMEGKISYVNQVYLDMSGYSREELLGNNYEFLLPTDEVDKPQTQMMWTSLREGNFFNGQFKQQSKAGGAMWLSGAFNPITDKEGKPHKVMMFAQFNTREKEKYDDLCQMLSAFKNSTPMVEFDSEGLFKSGNEKFMELMGYSRLEMRKQPIDFFIDTTGVKKRLKSLFNAETKEEILTLVTKNGEKKIFRITFNPIENIEGEVVKTVAILAEDLTQIEIVSN